MNRIVTGQSGLGSNDNKRATLDFRRLTTRCSLRSYLGYVNFD